jgi:hypothetical protein
MSEEREEVKFNNDHQRPGAQDAIDWGVFAAKFHERNGFLPHRQDSGHQEYFHWFTVGAHAEFMGRLNP